MEARTAAFLKEQARTNKRGYLKDLLKRIPKNVVFTRTDNIGGTYESHEEFVMSFEGSDEDFEMVSRKNDDGTGVISEATGGNGLFEGDEIATWGPKPKGGKKTPKGKQNIVDRLIDAATKVVMDSKSLGGGDLMLDPSPMAELTRVLRAAKELPNLPGRASVAPTLDDYQRMRQAIIDHMDAHGYPNNTKGSKADHALWAILDRA